MKNQILKISCFKFAKHVQINVKIQPTRMLFPIEYSGIVKHMIRKKVTQYLEDKKFSQKKILKKYVCLLQYTFINSQIIIH